MFLLTTIIGYFSSTKAESPSKLDKSSSIQTFTLLNILLEYFVPESITELKDAKPPDLLELKYSSIADAKEELGDIQTIRETFIGFREYLYTDKVI
jgi:hypothetical protein